MGTACAAFTCPDASRTTVERSRRPPAASRIAWRAPSASRNASSDPTPFAARATSASQAVPAAARARGSTRAAWRRSAPEPASAASPKRAAIRRARTFDCHVIRGTVTELPSAVPPGDVLGERRQEPARRLNARRRRVGLVEGAVALAERPLEAEHRRVRELVLGRVLAGGLAESCGILRDVEEIVGDLEEEPDRVAVARDAREGRLVGARVQRAELHGQPDETPRLERVDLLQP